MIRAAILVLIIGCLTSCSVLENRTNVVEVEGRYSLEIPMMLTEVTNLHEEASLQYQHALHSYYVIVIDEPKSDMSEMLVENDLLDYYTDDFEGYADIIFNNFDVGLTELQTNGIEDTRIDGLPAKLLNFSGYMDDIHLYYQVGMIEGAERYYQIIVWSLFENKTDSEKTMLDIVHSFKKLNSDGVKPVEQPAGNNRPPQRSGNKR